MGDKTNPNDFSNLIRRSSHLTQLMRDINKVENAVDEGSIPTAPQWIFSGSGTLEATFGTEVDDTRIKSTFLGADIDASNQIVALQSWDNSEADSYVTVFTKGGTVVRDITVAMQRSVPNNGSIFNLCMLDYSGSFYLVEREDGTNTADLIIVEVSVSTGSILSTRTWSGAGGHAIHSTWGGGVDSSGNFYCSDASSDHSIIKIDTGGTGSELISQATLKTDYDTVDNSGANKIHVVDMTVDRSENIIIAATWSRPAVRVILIYNTSGVLQDAWDISSSGIASSDSLVNNDRYIQRGHSGTNPLWLASRGGKLISFTWATGAEATSLTPTVSLTGSKTHTDSTATGPLLVDASTLVLDYHQSSSFGSYVANFGYPAVFEINNSTGNSSDFWDARAVANGTFYGSEAKERQWASDLRNYTYHVPSFVSVAVIDDVYGYALDRSSGYIHVFDPSSITASEYDFVSKFCGVGSGAGQVVRAGVLGVSSDSVYVEDIFFREILRFNTSGTFQNRIDVDVGGTALDDDDQIKAITANSTHVFILFVGDTNLYIKKYTVAGSYVSEVAVPSGDDNYFSLSMGFNSTLNQFSSNESSGTDNVRRYTTDLSLIETIDPVKDYGGNSDDLYERTRLFSHSGDSGLVLMSDGYDWVLNQADITSLGGVTSALYGSSAGKSASINKHGSSYYYYLANSNVGIARKPVYGYTLDLTRSSNSGGGGGGGPIVSAPMEQTEWFLHQTDGTKVSLGDPDGGVHVPDLNALYRGIPANELTNNAQFLAAPWRYIVDVRKAIETIAETEAVTNSVSGSAFNWTSGDTTDNLYYVAMNGKMGLYGADEPAGTNWKRPSIRDIPTNEYMDIDVGEMREIVDLLMKETGVS